MATKNKRFNKDFKKKRIHHSNHIKNMELMKNNPLIIQETEE